MRATKTASVLFFTPGEEEIGWFRDCLNTEYLWFDQPVEGGMKMVLKDYRPV
jgi:hypothetical protein